jgi:hypothetical protein
MRVKCLVTKNSSKRGTTVGWSVSAINKGGLKKAKTTGFLSASMEYTLPGGEVVPRPAEGFRVMFLSSQQRNDIKMPPLRQFSLNLGFCPETPPNQSGSGVVLTHLNDASKEDNDAHRHHRRRH